MTKRQRTKRVRARPKRDAPAPKAVIGLQQLADMLGTTPAEALELGRAASLPWVFGGRADFYIDGEDLSIWLGASRRAHNRKPDGDNA